MECNHLQHQVGRTNVSFWSSGASYVRLNCRVQKFPVKSVVVNLSRNRYACCLGLESVRFLLNSGLMNW